MIEDVGLVLMPCRGPAPDRGPLPSDPPVGVGDHLRGGLGAHADKALQATTRDLRGVFCPAHRLWELAAPPRVASTLVLTAAVVHGSWNLIVKHCSDATVAVNREKPRVPA